MNDLADDGFHEIQLSGKQLVFLFMATTIVAVVIFLCGVQVGRGVRSERAASTDAGDTLASATPPPASSPSQPAAAGGPPAAEPPTPAQEPADELSYAKRLQSDGASTEKLKPQGSSASAPVSQTPAAAPTRPAPPKPQPKTAVSAPQSSGRAGAWIVQVISLQDRGAASVIAKRLTGKGYPAFVLDPSPGSPAIYRVQVGGYPDKNEAEQASRRLEKDEQFKPLVRAR